MTKHHLLIALVMTAMVACDSAEETAAPITLAPEDVIADLETDALMVFCESASATLEAINIAGRDPGPICTGQGLAARFGGDGAVATCEEARDACIEEMASTPVGDVFAKLGCTDESTVTSALGACDFTVAEFDACTEAINQSMVNIQESLSCEITNEEALALQGMTNDYFPDECIPVQDACPTLFGTGPSGH